MHRERAEGRGRITSTVGFAATEREAKEALALTYGMITMIDDVVGRVLARLKALGLDENTVVIFTSDHGDFMGDHGLLLKSALHYQSLVRVPSYGRTLVALCLVLEYRRRRWPAPSTSQRPCSLVLAWHRTLESRELISRPLCKVNRCQLGRLY